MKNIPLRGKNICIAIIDSGIHPHKDLRNRIISFTDFVSGKSGAYDDNSHGTHVAGIAAGDGSASKGMYRGIAIEARLIGLKVLDRYGNGNKENFVKALYWILNNQKKYNISLVNISIGSATDGCNDEVSEINDILNEMSKRDIVIVSSAGNMGPGKGTITFPGTSEHVITVGNKDKTVRCHGDNCFLDFYSGEGPTKCNIEKPDLVAPGTNIISCNNRGSSYTIKSGSSMSTPIVTGAIALLKEKNPALSPKEIRRVLKASCDDCGMKDTQQGAGELNIHQLLRAAFFSEI